MIRYKQILMQLPFQSPKMIRRQCQLIEQMLWELLMTLIYTHICSGLQEHKLM